MSISQQFLPLIWLHFSNSATRKMTGAAGKSRVCSAASNSAQSRQLTVRSDECELFQKVRPSWQRKVMNSCTIQARGENPWPRCKFPGKEKRKILREHSGCIWLARRTAKLIGNLSETMVTSMSVFLSLYLSLSLSLSPNVPHTQYRKRFRASYNKENLKKAAMNKVTNQMPLVKSIFL